MSLTEIEQFLYGGPCGHFVTAFRLLDREIVIELSPMEDDRPDGATKVIATFSEASATGLWRDPSESLIYPLDPIGFVCSSIGERWKFVLNCGAIEWSWESLWPTLVCEKMSDIRSVFNLGSSGASNITKDKDRMVGEAFDAARRHKP